MKTFMEYKLEKSINIGIDGFTNNLSKKTFSHKGAWSRIIKCQLNEKGYERVNILDKHESWHEYKIMIIDMGMEYKGTLNLFGGANDALAKRLNSIYSYWDSGGIIFTIEGDFPDINELIKSRWNSASDDFKKLIELDNWDNMKENIPKIDIIDCEKDVLVGDSHSLSVWRSNTEIHRHDGKTLSGMLRKGLLHYVPDREINKLILYFGNIDIRHHLLRRDNPLYNIDLLLEDLMHQINALTKCHLVEIVASLPIENESRKIPKTGYYKGTPYYGTWSERNRISEYFTKKLNKFCFENKHKVFNWPKWYKNSLGELSFATMEKPKSVHLSPEYYYWDLNKNEINKNYVTEKKEYTLF